MCSVCLVMKTQDSITETTPVTPRQILRDIYVARKAKNPAYSLRAFARDIGMSQPLLSLVLGGQRPLTLKQAHKISVLLALNPIEEKRFLDSTLAGLPENAKVAQKIRLAKQRTDSAFLPKNLDIEKYHLIATWYHLAILDLTTTTGFDPRPSSIAARLGISVPEAEAAIERLLLLGLLTRVKGGLKKTALHIQFPTQESKAAVRSFHRQTMEKAIDQLSKTDDASFAARSITGHTVAVDSSRIEEAKKFIEAVQAEFIRRFTAGQPDEVYQFSVQLFPLTQIKSLKGARK